MVLVNTPITKKCEICGKVFFKKVNISRKDWFLRKCCSKKCGDKSRLGKPTWNKGIKIDREKYPNYGHLKRHTKEALKKITKANKENARKHSKNFYRENQKLAIESARKDGFKNFKGTLGKTKELSANWLGNKASYSSIHKWIQKHWKKKGACQNCGRQPKLFKNKKCGTEWHSLDGKFNRDDKETWVELCKKCHCIYDKKA